MAATQRKDTRELDGKKAQEKIKRPEPAPEHMKALADESVSSAGLWGVSAMAPPLESHAAFLGDPRFSHRANNAQKARTVTGLQGTYGNQYVQRLVESLKVQGKLIVNPPDDVYEREADRVADAVTRASTRSIQCQAKEEEEEPIQTKLTNDGQVQRQAEEPEEEEEEEEPIQTKLTNGIQVQRQTEEPEEEEEEEPIQTKKAREQTPLIGSSLQSRINSLKGDGQPLPESTRKHFEPRFGSSFNQVRVHTGSEAAETARSINAKAFTSGKDVVFGAEQYSPETSDGKRLLAHELTHVVQQENKRTNKYHNRKNPRVSVNSLISPRIQRQVLEGVGVGIAVLSFGKDIVSSGDLSSKCTPANCMHKKTPKDAKWGHITYRLCIAAHHPRYTSAEWQRFYFELEYDFNGWDIRHAKITLLRSPSAKMYMSTFGVTWSPQMHSRPNDPVAEIQFNIGGTWDPWGRGKYEFKGELIISAARNGRAFEKFTIKADENRVKAA